MIFVVQFLRDVSRGSGPRIVRSVEFEADELYSVVSRTRIILACTDFDPVVEAFRILIDGTKVVHQEHRGSVDDGGAPPAIGYQDRTITSTTSPS
jgi:hypothetical protein